MEITEEMLEEIREIYFKGIADEDQEFIIRCILPKDCELYLKVWLSMRSIFWSKNLQVPILLWFTINEGKIIGEAIELGSIGRSTKIDYVGGFQDSVMVRLKEYKIPKTFCFISQDGSVADKEMIKKCMKFWSHETFMLPDKVWWDYIFEKPYSAFEMRLREELKKAGSNILRLVDIKSLWLKTLEESHVQERCTQFYNSLAKEKNKKWDDDFEEDWREIESEIRGTTQEGHIDAIFKKHLTGLPEKESVTAM